MLIVTDGCAGLAAAIPTVCPQMLYQRSGPSSNYPKAPMLKSEAESQKPGRTSPSDIMDCNVGWVRASMSLAGGRLRLVAIHSSKES